MWNVKSHVERIGRVRKDVYHATQSRFFADATGIFSHYPQCLDLREIDPRLIILT